MFNGIEMLPMLPWKASPHINSYFLEFSELYISQKVLWTNMLIIEINSFISSATLAD